jgi:pyridinium-3,5-biscarboxylic acid mononucleotide sulfurtransferase
VTGTGTDPTAKEVELRTLVRGLGSVVLGLSGGVDSSLLARVCRDELDGHAVAVIARSPSLPRRELDTAREVAAAIGIEHVVVDTAEVDDPRYAANPRNRCFFCKDELFSHLARVATQRGLDTIAYGENVDDDGDHRPGRAAAIAHDVRAPLREAGLTKADVRALARRLDLPVWDKPAFACLASRFPYGTEITAERLAQVDAAEQALFELGFDHFRVRYHGDVARIEVSPDRLADVVDRAPEVVEHLRAAGFQHVTLDLDGYRRGSLNSSGPARSLPLAD